MPQNSNFGLPRGHWFRPKLEFMVMAPNHSWEPLGFILGPMGTYWVQKMGQNHKKWPCPKIRIFDYPAVIDFEQNSTWRLGGKLRLGNPRVHLGANGVPLGKKNGSKPQKNYHVPKEFWTKIDFDQNSTLRLWRQITVETPWGPSWGQWGPIGSKKWVKTVQNYHAQKF